MVTVDQQALVDPEQTPSPTKNLIEEEQILRDSLETKKLAESDLILERTASVVIAEAQAGLS